MTAREYRKAYGFDVKRGQLAGEYLALKATQAIERGGYKNLKKGRAYWFKPGQPGLGCYERSEQTMARLTKKRIAKIEGSIDMIKVDNHDQEVRLSVIETRQDIEEPAVRKRRSRV